MIDKTTYDHEEPGWGSLIIDVYDSKRNYYGDIEPGDYSFFVKSIGASEIEWEPFHIFEWQKIQYSFISDAKSTFEAPFRLTINDRTEAISRERGNTHLLVGQFSFDDVIGETSVKIIDRHNRTLFKLVTEVFPQKMDYKSDYKAMMEDVSLIIQNLAFDSLKDTYRRSRARLYGHSTVNEWWNILDALFDLLFVNLSVIKRQPNHQIIKTERVLPVDRVKKASGKNLDWMRKNGQYTHGSKGVKVGLKTYYTHALASKKKITYDTYENRFIAWSITRIIERLITYRKHVEKTSGNKDYSIIIDRIKSYQARLQGILRESPFIEASEFENQSHFSTSLTRGAGYRDFMQIYLLLSRGLEIADNEIFKIEQKNVSTLYEYWCFLKLVQILKEQNATAIQYQDLIKLNAGKFHVSLKKGEQSKVVFKKRGSSETTTVYFNREFRKEWKKVFTYNQRPDYSVEFRKNGYENPFWYLFDAKYRFDENVDHKYQSYNVPQDAIGQLHRYRDAILHSEPLNSTYRGAIKNLGGIILYPYPLSEKEFQKNDFYKSIDYVNIGALPFLPSKTSLASEFLNIIINKRLPEEHFERFIDMDTAEYETHRESWKEWVTIDVIPKKDQKQRLDFLDDKMIHSIPYVKKSDSKLYMSEKILLIESGSRKATLYEVEKWEVLSHKELRELGTTWEHRAKKYVSFYLKNPTSVETPSNIAPVRFRYATMEGLRRYMNVDPPDENYFYVTHPDAARLYESFKHKGLDIDVSWVDNSFDSSLIVIETDSKKFFSSERFQDLHYKYNGNMVHLNEVSKVIN